MALTKAQVSIVDVNDGQQGESGHSYILDIVGGPRSVTYDQFGNPPSTNFNFSAELYVDGVLTTPSSYSWSTEGALSGSGTGPTFVPTLSAVANVSTLPGTLIKLTVNFAGTIIKQSEPIAIAQTGATGQPGVVGVGVSSVTEYYLATTAASGILISNPSWTTGVQALTVTNKYLWNYEKINYTDGTFQQTAPLIIGVYGDTGRSIDTIQEYYLVSAASTGVTTATVGWSINIPTMTSTLKHLWNYEKITYKNPVSVENTVPVIIGIYGDKGEQGVPGTPARIINLISTSQILKKPAGTETTVPATTTVSAVVLNTGTLSWTYSVNGAAFSTTRPTGVAAPSGDSVTITGSTMTANTIAIKVTDGVVSDTYTVAKVQDGVDGPSGIPGAVGQPGADAYTVILSNESHVFAGNISNALAGSTYFDVIAYKGVTRVGATVGTITGAVTGLTPTITNNGLTTARVTVTVTTSMVSNGILTIPITVDGKVFTKQFTFAISFKGATGATGSPGAAGAPGADGRSITSVDVWYYLSTSATVLAGGTWSTTAPTWVNGRYMWSKTITTYSSGTPTESTAANITGAAGATGGTGATGKGVTSIFEEYAISTSKTVAPTSFSTTRPTWTTGNYIWTRSKIVYNNPTSTAYTDAIPSTEWEAVNDIQIGGRNLLLNTSSTLTMGGYAGATFEYLDEYLGERNVVKITSPQNYIYFVPVDEYSNLNVGIEYTFSIRVMYEGLNVGSRSCYFSADSGSYTTLDGILSNTAFNTLQRQIVFVNSPISPRIHFNFSGYDVIYLSTRMKLEKGNKVTDYTAAPEDTDAFIEQVASGVAEANTQLREYSDANIMQLQSDIEAQLGTKELVWYYSADAPDPPMNQMIWVDTSKNPYVPKRYDSTAAIWHNLVPTAPEDIGAFPNDEGIATAGALATLETKFEDGTFTRQVLGDVDFQTLLAEKMDGSYASTFQQSIEGFDLNISSLQTIVTEQGVVVENVKDNFNFSPEGLGIGKSDSPFNVLLSNTELSFRNGDERLAWIGSNEAESTTKMFIAHAEITDEIIMGVHKITKHDADTTVIRWVG